MLFFLPWNYAHQLHLKRKGCLDKIILIRGDRMRAKIVLKDNLYYGRIIKVSLLSFDRVAGMLNPLNKIDLKFNDVEFIFDEPWERELIENRWVLNIKKPQMASHYIYYAIIKSVKEHIGENIDEIMVLKDVDNKFKGAWEKRVYAAINNKPIAINISGKDYINSFQIKIMDIEREEFIKRCFEEIEESKNGLKMYTKRLNGLMYTINKIVV